MLTYLALGDSYTIGEQVGREENFPSQLANMLKKQTLPIDAPKIIATTGWTTDELANAIKEAQIAQTFDFVTLLIGVNDQYRGRAVAQYKKGFEQLLHQAINFANGRSSRVFVLSIPDWGVTPFAEGKNRGEIAHQIDLYNNTKEDITRSFGCTYLDITKSTRLHGNDESFLTPDKLHYSPKEYKIWAEQLCPLVISSLDQ